MSTTPATKRRSARNKDVPVVEQITEEPVVPPKKSKSSKPAPKDDSSVAHNNMVLEVMKSLKESLSAVNSRMDSFEQRKELAVPHPPQAQQKQQPEDDKKRDRKIKKHRSPSPSEDEDDSSSSDDSSSVSSSSDSDSKAKKKARSKVIALCSTFKVPEPSSSSSVRELFLLKKSTDVAQLQISRNRHEGEHILQVIEILLRGSLDSTARHALATLSARAQQLVLMEKRNPDFANEWGKSIALQTQDQDDILTRANRFGLMAESRKRPNKSSPPTKKRHNKHPSKVHVKREEKAKPAAN